MKFEETLENFHVLKSEQLMVFAVAGCNDTPFDSSYKNRGNDEYHKSLGEAIARLISRIPGGTLIFFPSYLFIDKCKELWTAKGIMDQIACIKPIFDEPKERAKFVTVLTNF